MLKTFAKLGKIASENLYFQQKDRELIKKSKKKPFEAKKRRGSTVCWPHCCGERLDFMNGWCVCCSV